MKDDILIKSTVNTAGDFDGNLVMKVWPDHTVFVDWLNDKSQDLIKKGLDDLYAKV